LDDEDDHADEGSNKFMFATKKDAIDAFKAAFQSANVGSEWTYETAAKAIANDARFGALRTLRERKAAFAEYVVDRRRQEKEDKRSQEKQLREDFKALLRETPDLDAHGTYKYVRIYYLTLFSFSPSHTLSFFFFSFFFFFENLAFVEPRL
jgi:ATP adenylyltransferase/5',5'''-P-1,P-4-tetraphosphate phosphorylase II